MGAARDYSGQPRKVDPKAIITFSRADSRTSTDWQMRTLPLEKLLAALTDLKVGKKSEGSVWSPATYDGGQRKAATALGTFIITWDADSGHTLDEIDAAFRPTGWHIVIIPSSSWGAETSEVSGDAYDRWVADVAEAEGEGADTGVERYLIDVLQKTPAVAKGAVIEASFDQIEIGKDGQRSLRKLIRIRHQPCQKYRILGFLPERYDLSTTLARRAYRRYYDAMCDLVGLPLDRTSGSVERLLYQSRLPADRIEAARDHIRTIPGDYIDLTALPEPLPRQRVRRGPIRGLADERVRGRGSDDDELEYHWTDPVTGQDIDLRAWAVTGMAYLPLADILRDSDWPLDDRGELDGKLHVVCPFQGQHTSLQGGGTYVSNAADFERTGMVDRRHAAVIHCSHNSCKERDRLEFITEFLRAGALTTAHLLAAREEAKAVELARDFDVIPDPDNVSLKPLIRPSLSWDRADIEARLPQLKRLAREDAAAFDTFRQGWDIVGTIDADELDLCIDLAANDDAPIDPGPGGGEHAAPVDKLWRTKLVRSEKGTPNTGTKNLMLALEHGLRLGGVVGYNMLKQRIDIRDPGLLPWGHTGEAPRPWSDRDDTLAAALIEDELQGVVKPHSITPVIEALAWKYKFHPVLDYLNAQTWDGVSRLDTLLIDNAGVADEPYARAVLARTLIGAVARVMRPGCKMDTALILESDQGFKKSSLFATLAVDPEFFTDNLPGALGEKSVAEIVGSHWIIEMGELTNLKKGEVDRTKAFMSRTSDTYRPAYGRRVVDFPRQCILTGTVNGEITGYLRDLTGNRRFWTLKTGRINLAAVMKIRDQLWAEAVARFHAGERWWFDDELDGELVEAQKIATQERTEETEMTEMVRRFLTHRPGVSGFDQDHIDAWRPRRTPITVIPSISSFFSAIGTPTRNIKFSDKVAFKQALQMLGWKIRQNREMAKTNPLGLERGARFFVAPEADDAGNLHLWLQRQIKKWAVAGMGDPDAGDDNVIHLDDRKKR